MAKKKKKELLLCTCARKSIFGKKKNFEGVDCTCDPYPNGMKKGQDYEKVFITSVS